MKRRLVSWENQDTGEDPSLNTRLVVILPEENSPPQSFIHKMSEILFECKVASHPHIQHSVKSNRSELQSASSAC